MEAVASHTGLEKLPQCRIRTLVTESGKLLLPMHEKFFCVLKCASQVCILPDPEIFAIHNIPSFSDTMMNWESGNYPE